MENSVNWKWNQNKGAKKLRINTPQVNIQPRHQLKGDTPQGNIKPKHLLQGCKTRTDKY